MARPPVMYEVPVDDGQLAVRRWGRAGAPTVVAAHGITSSHQAWSAVGDLVGADLCLLAPDLRGRGDSATVPGPYGMQAHARDLLAVLDHAGIERALIAGHSMGGFVAAAFANLFPERTDAVVLVDGGPALADPLPPDADVDAVLAQVIGPALARLDQRFGNRDEYRGFWRDHPAFANVSVSRDRIDAYADHDLHGPPGEMRSKVSADAVRADAADTLCSQLVQTALARLQMPAVLLLAARGMLDGPTPLYPDDAVAGLRTARGALDVVRVPDTNHYTIVLGDDGARAIAGHLRRFAVAAQR